MAAIGSPVDQARPGARRLEVLILLLAAAWLTALANRGVNVSDEGFLFARAHELARGRTIFRDYYSHTAPLGFMIQAVLIRLFGFSLIAGRVYGVVQGVAMVWIALRLMRRRLESPFALIPAVIFIPYSVALCGYPTYNLDTIFFLLVSLAMIEGYLVRPRPSLAFGAALFGALAVACKQTAAAVALPTVLLALWLARPRFRDRRAVPELVAAGLGFGLPGLFFVAYLAQGHALVEAAQCLVGTGGTRTLVLYHLVPPALLAFLGGALALRGLAGLSGRWPRLSAPLWATALLAAVALVAFARWQISSPFLCGAIALGLLLWVKPDGDKDRSFWIVVRVFGLTLFGAGLLANVDLSHMLMSSVGAFFLAGPLAQKLWDQRGKVQGRARLIVAAAGLTGVLAAGVYLDFKFLDLYFQTGPRWKATAPIDLAGARGIRATPDQAQALTRTVTWIKRHTAPDEKIFAYPWDCLFYPLADRLSASYYTFILYDSIDRPGVDRMIADLERDQTRVIVVEMEGDRIKHVVFDDLKAIIDPYLRSNFEPVERFGQYQIMTRIRRPETGPKE